MTASPDTEATKCPECTFGMQTEEHLDACVGEPVPCNETCKINGWCPECFDDTPPPPSEPTKAKP